MSLLNTDNINFFKEALLNKDVFTTLWSTGITIIFLSFLFYRDREKDKLMKIYIDSIVKAIGKHVIEDLNILIGLGERSVRSATTKKLNFIKRRLIQNDIYKNNHIIKHHIRTTLIDISDKSYIQYLNNFNTKIGLYGEWIQSNFDMDNFLDEVYKVFFDKDMSIDRKIELIESIMQDFQTQMWNDFKLALNT